MPEKQNPLVPDQAIPETPAVNTPAPPSAFDEALMRALAVSKVAGTDAVRMPPRIRDAEIVRELDAAMNSVGWLVFVGHIEPDGKISVFRKCSANQTPETVSGYADCISQELVKIVSTLKPAEAVKAELEGSGVKEEPEAAVDDE